ncbi:MAG TPA: FliA/WhiG family RNA polymerase sigma factor [Terriglobales bacterium]|nr:FliA/WhiG family RNA polymerase sigma factor [Terriglobales bacterium]
MTKHPAHAYQGVANEAERERILLDQLPQVRYIARRIHERLPRHVPFEDLVHAGVLGLIDALGKFDQSKHVQFSSYAKFRIRGAILDSLRELDWSPRELRRKGRQVEEAHNQLSIRLGRTPTENDLARELGISLEELQSLLSELNALEIGSLRIEMPQNGREEDLAASVPAKQEDTPFFQCLRSEMKELLARAISELPEKEQRVLSLYYFEELTMKEVGAVLGIGESRVSQIHSLAMVRLRARLSFLNAGNQERVKGASAGGQ